MASTIANLNLGAEADGRNSSLRNIVEGYYKDCATAMSKTAQTLAQVEDMKGVLEAGTAIDKYHKTLERIVKLASDFFSFEDQGVAERLRTAIKDNLVKFEEGCANDWLDKYAKFRPGPRIKRQASGCNMDLWHSITSLRLTLEGPNHTYHENKS